MYEDFRIIAYINVPNAEEYTPIIFRGRVAGWIGPSFDRPSPLASQ